MKKRIILLLLLGCPLLVFAQNKTGGKIISDIETEATYGFGGGTYGLFIKISHNWLEKNDFKLRSGLSSAYFYKKDNLESSIYTRNGMTDDLHFNFHLGIAYFFLKQKAHVFFEPYLGYYYLRNKGEYQSTQIVFIDGAYHISQNLFDWGTRIGIAYSINEKIGIQFSMTNSFNDFEVFSGSESSKIYFGLGINYALD